jgi:acyl-homoserine lactone acylase PvdQ
MTRLIYLLALLALSHINCAQPVNGDEVSRWEKQSRNVTIIRDNYGVPHIYGKTDADCVFGLMYAQCEDDFQRVERNYITMLGRTSEVTGEKDIYEDLLVRMTIDSAGALRDYQNSPEWLKKLMNAHADGINYFLYKHPDIKPALLHRFQPWYPLMYTDGSISAIQTGGLSANDIKSFYASLDVSRQSGNQEKQPSKSYANRPGKEHPFLIDPAAGNQVSAFAFPRPGADEQLSGSNGFAIAPEKSASGKAMLYINPHVTFYFRPEVHMISEEGMNVYGAVTWGQFFVYQGFNEHLGFMHTSSAADAADLYEEKITEKDGKYFYTYEGKLRSVTENKETIKYLREGKWQSKTFTVYSTHHGPVMAMMNGKWLSLKTNNRSLNGLMQSWQRIRTKSLSEFKTNLFLKANLSNNTVYADDKGNIAYWHGNYMPKRDSSYDWNEPVDGSVEATEWKGMHMVDELVQSINPASGWIQNCNGTPYSVAGKYSPSRKEYPAYMAPDGENFRQLNAVRVLSKTEKFTMDGLINAGYDRHLTAFDSTLPILFGAHQKLKESNNSLYVSVLPAIQALKDWDRNMNETSVAQALAIEWAERINAILISDDPEYFTDYTTRVGLFLRKTAPEKVVGPLADVMQKLTADFGKWEMPWGEINRMQRISNDLTPKHDDAKPSYPSPFSASTWGALPSYNSRYYRGTKKRYGYGGNSFICVVEFGEKIRAKSLLAGGESGNPASRHFFDQGEMYTRGKFKDVLFYKEDVLKHAEKTYHPGE